MSTADQLLMAQDAPSDAASAESQVAIASGAGSSSELLTVPQAARRAGVSVTTISKWIAQGRLPANRVHGRRRVSHRVRLDDLLATQTSDHVGGMLTAWQRDPQRAGHRLRALREAAGLSQLQLAAASAAQEPFRRDNLEYWGLVQQLMHFGWYRIGPGPTDELGRETWGFLEGHVIAGSTQRPIWVPASAEIVAMRILLTVVQTRG